MEKMRPTKKKPLLLAAGCLALAAVVVIHDLTLALRFCDRFLLMRDGQVYRCGGLEVLDKTALREVYDVDAEPVTVNGRPIVLVNE